MGPRLEVENCFLPSPCLRYLPQAGAQPWTCVGFLFPCGSVSESCFLIPQSGGSYGSHPVRLWGGEGTVAVYGALGTSLGTMSV